MTIEGRGSSPGANWYQDSSGRIRWWDGSSWGAYAPEPNFIPQQPSPPLVVDPQAAAVFLAAHQDFARRYSPGRQYPTPVPGFVLSMVSVLFCFTVIGLITGLIGFIMSWNSMQATPPGTPRRSLAVWGFVVGLIFSGVSLILMTPFLFL